MSVDGSHLSASSIPGRGPPVGGHLSPGAPHITGVLSVGGLKPLTPPDTALRLVHLLRPLGELAVPPLTSPSLFPAQVSTTTLPSAAVEAPPSSRRLPAWVAGPRPPRSSPTSLSLTRLSQPCHCRPSDGAALPPPSPH
jgi:hypothetical protein